MRMHMRMCIPVHRRHLHINRSLTGTVHPPIASAARSAQLGGGPAGGRVGTAAAVAVVFLGSVGGVVEDGGEEVAQKAAQGGERSRDDDQVGFDVDPDAGNGDGAGLAVGENMSAGDGGGGNR
jgi:hypothetical protein